MELQSQKMLFQKVWTAAGAAFASYETSGATATTATEISLYIRQQQQQQHA